MGAGTDLAVCTLAAPAPSYAALDFEDALPSETLVAVGFAAEPHGQDLRSWRAEVVRTAKELELRLPRGGVCRGDSGGPAFALRDGHLVVVAVASSRPRGRTCEDESLVNYTKLSASKTWLRTAMDTAKRP